MSTKTAELTPAVKYLVESANSNSAEEFKFLLESFNGKFASGMIQEALDNLDEALTPSGNVALLKRRIRQLEREVLADSHREEKR